MEQIQGYEGLYEIHLNGPNDQPAVWGKKTKRYLKSGTSSSGYQIVSLCKDNKKSSKPIHRIVAEHFINNPDDKCSVDHINQIKNNNKLQNLRWLTTSEQKINDSRTKGYSWHKTKKKFQVQIMVNGKSKHLGYFSEDSEDDARNCYLDGKKKYYPDL